MLKKMLFLRFACPIRLIPVPIVLVKIINGKFGIFGYKTTPKGILVNLMMLMIISCRKQVKGIERMRIDKCTRYPKDFYKLR